MQLYTNRVCKYALIRLNGEHKETAEPDKLNIEHIMPQSLDADWKVSLGENHEEIHERHLHTIGNLTLTAYNSELGNMSFSRKRDIYKDSMVAMTKALAGFERWGEGEIRERAGNLAEKAVQIWQYPEGYDNRGEAEKDEQVHDLMLEEDYLEGKDTVQLWYALKNGVQAACPGIVFRMNKRYASFRLPSDQGSVDAVVCSFESIRNGIHITYNTKTDDGIITSSDFVNDISTRHYGSGDLRTTIASVDDVARVVCLVKDVWDSKSGSQST